MKRYNKQNRIQSSVYSECSKPEQLVYDLTTNPQIYHYYYEPKQLVSTEETIIPIYFSDWYQREYFYDDTSLNFKLRLDVDGNIQYIDNLKSGDYNLSLGVLDVGEHQFNIEVEDKQHNLKSQRLFNTIWIVDKMDIEDNEIYYVSSSDYSNYNITLDLDDTASHEAMTNNRYGMTNMLNDLHNRGYKKIVLMENSYIRVNADFHDTDINTHNPITIPTNTTLDLNGSTIKMHVYNDKEYGDAGQMTNHIIIMKNCIDSHLVNGTIEGNFTERATYQYNAGTVEEPIYENALKGINGEHDGGVVIYGGKYNTVENITLTNVTG